MTYSCNPDAQVYHQLDYHEGSNWRIFGIWSVMLIGYEIDFEIHSLTWFWSEQLLAGDLSLKSMGSFSQISLDTGKSSWT